MPDHAKPTEERPSIEKTLQWYSRVRPLYEGLSATVSVTLEKLIKQKGIDYVSVTERTKSIASLSEKLRRKAYTNPAKQIDDFSGIRVIAFIESDVKKIADLVSNSFHVHPDKSLDKTSELGVDRVGYRSTHLICDLGDKRTSLPEYASYKGLLFEVQIRTVLEHAWAEMSHERNYKLAGVLPKHLERRLNLAAGNLEMLDRELDAIAISIDEYKREVAQRADKGELQISIDTTSLTAYMAKRFANVEGVTQSDLDARIISELNNFGINTLAELESIFSEEFIRALETSDYKSTYLGLLRDAMMYRNIDRYFELSWNSHWNVTDSLAVDFLTNKYEKYKIMSILEKYNIHIEDEEDIEEEEEE